jgi:uncharacterized protein
MFPQYWGLGGLICRNHSLIWYKTMLSAFADRLRAAIGMAQKQDIQPIAQKLAAARLTSDASPILLGDDCAAIPDGDGYLLLAAEGMWPTLVEHDPWFAGWCSVLVNVSDIYAMGGWPIAVVDALWSESIDQAEPLWQGMLAASQALNVPIVGGHTIAIVPIPPYPWRFWGGPSS